MGRIVPPEEAYDPDEDPMGSGAPFAEPKYPNATPGTIIARAGTPIGIVAPDGSMKSYTGLVSSVSFDPIRSKEEAETEASKILGTMSSTSGTVTFGPVIASPEFVATVYGSAVGPVPASGGTPAPITRTIPTAAATSAFRSGGGGPRFAPRVDNLADELNFFRHFAAYLLEMVGGSIVLNDKELIDLMEKTPTIEMWDNMDQNTTTYRIAEDERGASDV